MLELPSILPLRADENFRLYIWTQYLITFIVVIKFFYFNKGIKLGQVCLFRFSGQGNSLLKY